MLEGATAVFALLYLSRGTGLHYCCVQVSIRNGCGAFGEGDRARQAGAVEGERGEREVELGCARGMSDGADGVVGIVADELVGAIDDHLRGVDAVEAHVLSVLGLAGSELVGGETGM